MLCRAKNVSVIEDCALSLLSAAEPSNSTLADISVYSFYKFLPVSSGGAIVVRNGDYSAFGATRSAGVRREMASLSRATRQTAVTVLAPLLRQLIRRSAARSPDPAISSMPDMPPSYYFDWSLVGRGMLVLDFLRLSLMDVGRASIRRRINFQVYLNGLDGGKGVSPLYASLPEGTVPLCFPVMVGQPSSLVAYLASKGISSNAWWAGYNRNFDYRPFSVSCDMKDHVVALPCHQLIDETVVGKITQYVNEWASSVAGSDLE